MFKRPYASVILLLLMGCSTPKSRAPSTETIDSQQNYPQQNLPIIDQEFAAVGRIYRPTNGAPCSGVLIEPKVVLTAHHCLRSMNESNRSEFMFIPGTSARPISPELITQAYRVVNVRTPSQPRILPLTTDAQGRPLSWPQRLSIQSVDAAVLILDRDVEGIRPIPIFGKPTQVAFQNHLPITVAGYPQEFSKIYRHQEQIPPTMGTLQNCQQTETYPSPLFALDCSVAKGNSGGPVLVRYENALYVLGPILVSAPNAGLTFLGVYELGKFW